MREHEHEMELVALQTAAGGIQYKRQCRICRQRTNAIAAATLAKADRDSAPLITKEDDHEFWEKQRRQQAAALEQLREAQKSADAEWWDRYNTYLRSDKWLRKRDKVMARDGGRCQACMDADATIVHHLTYKHVFSEPLFDLIAVCRNCHEAIHSQPESEALWSPTRH